MELVSLCLLSDCTHSFLVLIAAGPPLLPNIRYSDGTVAADTVKTKKSFKYKKAEKAEIKIDLPSIPKLPGSGVKKSTGGLKAVKVAAPKFSFSAPKIGAPSIQAPQVEVGAEAGQQAAAVAAAEVIALLAASSLVSGVAKKE